MPVPLFRLRNVAVIVALGAAVAVTPSLSAQSATSRFSRGEKPFTTISRMFLRESVRDSLVDLTRSAVGLQYRWGAMQPGRAFDCSGLVQWVMASFNVDVPRTSREQAKVGLEIPKDPSKLLPGDLLYFSSGRTVDHIGIYVGDGRYVHAARAGKGVVEANLPTGRWATSWWKGVRRVFTHEEEIEQLPAVLRSPATMPRLTS